MFGVLENQLYNTEQFKNCIYCFKKFDDAESLANHISEKYYFCKYFCPFCFYRAYSPCHVLVHQVNIFLFMILIIKCVRLILKYLL